MRPEERELAHVPRWCIVRTIRTQSVAEHAFFVARYAIDIARAIRVPVRENLIEYCLKHDDEELHSGDIPAPYKSRIQFPYYDMSVWKLTDDEKNIAKMADMLEAILFLVDEQLLGNRGVGLPLADLREQLEKMAFPYSVKSNTTTDSLSYWLNMRIDAHSNYRGRVR